MSNLRWDHTSSWMTCCSPIRWWLAVDRHTTQWFGIWGICFICRWYTWVSCFTFHFLSLSVFPPVFCLHLCFICSLAFVYLSLSLPAPHVFPVFPLCSSVLSSVVYVLLTFQMFPWTFLCLPFVSSLDFRTLNFRIWDFGHQLINEACYTACLLLHNFVTDCENKELKYTVYTIFALILVRLWISKA